MAATRIQGFPANVPLQAVGLGVYASPPFILNNQITATDSKDIDPSALNARVRIIPVGGAPYRFLDTYLAAFIPSGQSITGAPSINCYGRAHKTGSTPLFNLAALVDSTVPAFPSIGDGGEGVFLPLSPTGNDNTSTTDTVAFSVATASLIHTIGSDTLVVYPRRTFLLDGTLEVLTSIVTAGTVSDPSVKPFIFGVLRA